MGRNTMKSTEFKTWLKDNSLSPITFAVSTGLNYHTIVKWMHGAKPRKLFRDAIANKYPGCPLASE